MKKVLKKRGVKILIVMLFFIALISSAYSQYASYDSSLGAPKCINATSPCIADSSLLISRDNIRVKKEPNQPNTIDACSDGTSGRYQTDESVENITITSLNDSIFVAGDTVRVDAWVHCYSSNTGDNINFVYTNSTQNIQWRVVGYVDPCPSPGFNKVSTQFKLDNISGYHAVRVIIQWSGSTTDTCGTGSWDDNDDLVFYVTQSKPPNITLNQPLNNTQFNDTQDINFNFTAIDDRNATLSCSIYLDGTLNQTNNSVQNNTLTNFLITSISYGSHNWYINCTDGKLSNVSETRYFSIADTIPPSIYYNPNTDTNGAYNRNWIFINVTATDLNLDAVILEWSGINESLNKTGNYYVINKTGLPEGTYSFKVYANDSFGNINVTETRNITIDLTSPNIVLISPENNTVNKISNIIVFIYNVSDAISGINNCSLFINDLINETKNNITEGQNNFTKILENGIYNWSISCVDFAGNKKNSQNYYLTINLTPPQVSLDNPLDNSIFSSQQLSFNCSAYDDSSLVSIALYIWNSSGLYYLNTTNITGINVTVSWLAMLNDGNYSWNCLARDNAYLTSWALNNRTFIIDTLYPKITFVSPTLTNGKIINKNWFVVNISVDEANLKNITYYLFNSSGNLLKSVSFNYLNASNFTNLLDGIYYYNATAADIAGHVNATETRNITIDTLKPEITIISPQSKRYSFSSIPIQISANDQHLDKIWYVVNGNNYNYEGKTNLTLAEGNYLLVAYANDTAGNLANASVNFTIKFNRSILTDKEAYKLGDSVKVYGSYWRPNTTIVVNVTDPENFTIYRTNLTSNSSGNFQTTFSIDDLDIEGKYKIFAYELDNITKNNTKYFNVSLPPRITSIDILPNPAEIGQIVTIIARINDSDGINNVNIEINRRNYTMENISLNEYRYYYLQSNEGAYPFKIYAKDNKGVIGTSSIKYINIINSSKQAVLSTSVEDSKNNKLYVSFTIINPKTNTTILAKNGTSFNVSLSHGVYDIIIKPKNKSINQVYIKNATIWQDTTKIVDLDFINETGNFTKQYALKPYIAFEYATIKINASGNNLYKCSSWNFSNQTCYGNWTLFKTGLKPGKLYVFKLNPSDPGFAETLTTIKDAYIKQDSPDKNYGASPKLIIRSRPNRNIRSLIMFNISLPEGVRIDNAILSLYMTSAPSISRNYAIHRLINSWQEGIGDNQFNDATINGTTWNERYWQMPWNNAGGNYIGTATDIVASGTLANIWLSWNVTSDVRGFYNGSYPNYGWLIKDTVENTSSKPTAKFVSKDDLNNQQFLPRLEINYTDIQEPRILNVSYNESLVNVYNNTITVNVTDNINVSNVVIEKDFSINATMQFVSGLYIYEWINITPGIHYFKIYANDTSGNVNVSEVYNFTVYDTVKPSIEIISPGNKTYNNKTILVNISANDLWLDTIWFFNGSDNISYNTAGYYNFSDGQHILIAYANDTSSNINSTNVSFIVDTTAPRFNENNTRPLAGSIYNQTTSILFQINVSDDLTGIKEVKANISYNNVTEIINLTNVNDSIWQATFNNTFWPGTYSVAFIAIDNADNTNTTYTNFTIQDVTIPYVDIISPNAGENISNGTSLLIRVNVTDPYYDNIAYVKANITWNISETLINLSFNPINGFYEAVFSNTSKPGIYNITIIAADRAGNINASEKTWFNSTYDSTPPRIILKACNPDNVSIGYNITCNATIIDNTELSSVYVNVTLPNGTVIRPEVLNESSEYYFIFTETSLVGIYNVSWFANDTNNNINVTLTSFVRTQDVKAPEINNYLIQPLIIINGSNITLMINASDINLDRVYAIIKKNATLNETINLTNGVNYIYTNTSFIGDYNITLYAIDKSNNTASVSKIVIVRTPIIFNISIVDNNATGLNSTVKIYYDNKLIVENSSSIGNYSFLLANYSYDFLITALNNSISLMLRNITLDRDNNKQIIFDKAIISPYLLTYGIEADYNFSNVTLTLSYNNSGYNNEDYLKLYKCDSYNITTRSCLSGWREINSIQDKTDKTFIYNAESLSGFSIVEVQPKQETISGRRTSTSGGYILPKASEEELNQENVSEILRNCFAEGSSFKFIVKNKPYEASIVDFINNILRIKINSNNYFIKLNQTLDLDIDMNSLLDLRLSFYNISLGRYCLSFKELKEMPIRKEKQEKQEEIPIEKPLKRKKFPLGLIILILVGIAILFGSYLTIKSLPRTRKISIDHKVTIPIKRKENGEERKKVKEEKKEKIKTKTKEEIKDVDKLQQEKKLELKLKPSKEIEIIKKKQKPKKQLADLIREIKDLYNE